MICLYKMSPESMSYVEVLCGLDLQPEMKVIFIHVHLFILLKDKAQEVK